jgi:hypothetical protein
MSLITGNSGSAFMPATKNGLRMERVLRKVLDTQNCWVSGFWSSFGILNTTLTNSVELSTAREATTCAASR